MQQTTERPATSSRQGFLRRLLLRGESMPVAPRRESIETTTRPPAVIDLRDDVPARQWRLAVSDRLERLEEGMSLVADTMKRAFSQVYRSIEDLRQGGSAPPEQLERILEVSVASLKVAVEDLSESIHRVPYVLAAAADDITGKLEAVATETGPQALPIPPVSPVSPVSPDPDRPPSELLPATPFELEPVEDQFVPMDDDAEDLDARKIWEMEA